MKQNDYSLSPLFLKKFDNTFPGNSKPFYNITERFLAK